MDKVQIYYTTCCTLYYIVTLLALLYVSIHNYRELQIKIVTQIVFTFLFGLPIMGRIYGWW